MWFSLEMFYSTIISGYEIAEIKSVEGQATSVDGLFSLLIFMCSGAKGYIASIGGPHWE
jgi:hypothetical protein